MLVPTSLYVSLEVGSPSPGMDDALCDHVVCPWVMTQPPRPNSHLVRLFSVASCAIAWLASAVRRRTAENHTATRRKLIAGRPLAGWSPYRYSVPRSPASHADKPNARLQV